MAQNTTTSAQARTVTTVDRGKLDIKALVLLAVLLAAGFILNMFVGKAIGAMSGGMISPEFIISAFCLTILVVRPNALQALIIGLISAAVIQLTTTLPGADFVAEGVAAVLMALIVNAGMKTPAKGIIPIVGTFVCTFVSGFIFMLIRMGSCSCQNRLPGSAVFPNTVLQIFQQNRMTAHDQRITVTLPRIPPDFLRQGKALRHCGSIRII